MNEEQLKACLTPEQLKRHYALEAREKQLRESGKLTPIMQEALAITIIGAAVMNIPKDDFFMAIEEIFDDIEAGKYDRRPSPSLN